MQKILVVDDDLGIRELIEDILRMESYLPFLAANIKEAWDIVNNVKPNLIICDINIDNHEIGNGYDLLKHIKTNAETFSIPFLIISGQNPNKQMRHALQLGADDFLAKPFSNQDLISSIKALLNKNDNTKKYYQSQNESFKKAVVKSIPHEFRTPLNGILGFAQLIEMGIDDCEKEEIVSMAKTIYESGHRLLRLVQNYTTYIELFDLWSENQLISKNSNPISVASEIYEVAQNIASKYNRIESLEMNLYFDIEFFGNHSHLIKLFEELIDNAFKFSKDDDKILIQTNYNQFHVPYLEIYNSGIGISEIEINNISLLKQFGRDQYEQQGLGLGLSICKLIADLNKLKLEITGEKFKHTIVKIEFPDDIA